MGEGDVETGYVFNVLCNPIDYSPPGSSVHGISQARILERVAISLSRGSSWPKNQTCISCISRWILYHWASWESRYILQDGFYSQKISLFFPQWSGSLSVVSASLQPHGLYSPWNSPGQNIGVGSLSRLQGVFLIQESNRGLLHCRQILYQLRFPLTKWFLKQVCNFFLECFFFNLHALNSSYTQAHENVAHGLGLCLSCSVVYSENVAKCLVHVVGVQ